MPAIRHVDRNVVSNIFPFINKCWKFLSDAKFTIPVGSVILLIDALICLLAIRFVKYTEIDWSTYMQQVEKFYGGQRNYTQIYGDTGPLVYPAGHLLIFSLFRTLSHQGTNIFAAQCIFLVIYLVNAALVIAINDTIRLVPPYALVLMFLTSYRIHSIFLLRLFNDPVAVTLFHVSLFFFLRKKWTWGCVLFSLAVSVKMNILLFAPGLLLLMLEHLSPPYVFLNLCTCAFIQIAIGFPFLVAAPVSYIRGAFDLSRIFLYKWTVNWRFVPEHLFVSRLFHVSLFLLHVIVLLFFHRKRWAEVIRRILFSKAKGCKTGERHFRPTEVALTLFTVNLIGIVFSRSLHYQFYVWYFYSIPALLWSTRIPVSAKMFFMLLIEYCWNCYPSTNLSSCLLLLLHILILSGLLLAPSPILDHRNKKAKDQEQNKFKDK